MKKYALLVGVLVLSLVALSGCSIPRVPSWLLSASSATPVPTVTPAVVPSGPSVGAIAALEGTLEQIYVQVNPSVVNIRVVQTREVEMPALTVLRGNQEQTVGVTLAARPNPEES